MTYLALIRIAEASVVTAPILPGAIVDLPGVGRVSPAQAGWVGGGSLTYVEIGGKSEAVEGEPQFKLVEMVEFPVPEGKQIVGVATYAYAAATDTAIETYQVEDIPQPPAPLTATEKLAAAGLSVADLKQLLGIS